MFAFGFESRNYQLKHFCVTLEHSVTQMAFGYLTPAIRAASKVEDFVSLLCAALTDLACGKVLVSLPRAR